MPREKVHLTPDIPYVENLNNLGDDEAHSAAVNILDVSEASSLYSGSDDEGRESSSDPKASEDSDAAPVRGKDSHDSTLTGFPAFFCQ